MLSVTQQVVAEELKATFERIEAIPEEHQAMLRGWFVGLTHNIALKMEAHDAKFDSGQFYKEIGIDKFYKEIGID